MFDEKLILSNTLFNKLSSKVKEVLTISYAKEQDDWSALKLPEKLSEFKRISNVFIDNDGCNCLATVLYAISKDETYLQKWVTQQEFVENLSNYKEINDNKFKRGDVVVFYGENNIQHACYSLDGKLFLNKSGQSKFNPILVLKFEDIYKDWDGLNYKILRKSD